MKHLKMSMMLLLTVAIFTSCEKETVINESIEKNELKNLELNPGGLITEFNFEGYQKKFSNQNKKSTGSAKIVDQETGLTYYTDSEEFDLDGCGNLVLEDFVSVPHEFSNTSFPSPLNEYSNNIYYQPGYIVPNVSISAASNALFVYNINDVYRVSAYYHEDKTIVDFSTEVYSFSLDLFGGNRLNDIEVEIYSDDELLDVFIITDVESVLSNQSTFFGIKSNKLITKFTLNSITSTDIELFGNLRFGTCDSDNDGALDADDPYPNSNMSEMVSIGENNLDIENVFTAEGTTMMDQIDALIAEINAQYDGENWDELHRDFTRGIAKITYYWRKDRLITRGERSDISSAAWSANIPYFNERD